MNLLSDIITYVRRIIKSPSNAVITDSLIIDYINRFWLLDMDARMQLYDFKTKYGFQMTPGMDQYNMPLYSVQTEDGGQSIASYPVYQGFRDSAYVNGIQIPFYNTIGNFWNLWPNYIQPLQPVAVGDGVTTSFRFFLPYFPAIPGHLDITGIIANVNSGNNLQDPIFANEFPVNTAGFITLPTTSFYPAVNITYKNSNGSITTITDSGLFLNANTNKDLTGLLMVPGNPPFGNTPLSDTNNVPNQYSPTLNTVNYVTGEINVNFPIAPAFESEIQVQCYFYEQGIPRAVLYYNNCLTFRPPPYTEYFVEIDCYLTPAAFLSTNQSFPFGYMSEYIARGAARKILSDTGDTEQFMFYEPLFREQENLVWKRSQRQFTTTRTGTIFSETQGQTNVNNIGQGTN
jgi:hypothetical protein